MQYNGKEGEAILSKFKDSLKNILPKNIKPRFTFKGKKVGSFFQIKDPGPLEHQTNLVYGFKHEGVRKYVGQTNVRLVGWINIATQTSNPQCSSTKILKESTFQLKTLKSLRKDTPGWSTEGLQRPCM